MEWPNGARPNYYPSPVSPLREFMGGKRLKKGALARVSEHLSVQPGTVKNWLCGAWKASADMQAKIDTMIADGISLAPDYRKCGRPRGSRKQVS